MKAGPHTRRAAKLGSPDAKRLIGIVRDPIYKKWAAALRAYERTLEKRAKEEVDRQAVWRAHDKASKAYNWLPALPLTPAELEQEHAQLSALNARKAETEAGASATRAAGRRAELAALDAAEAEHTVYVPGVGYVRGKRVIG